VYRVRVAEVIPVEEFEVRQRAGLVQAVPAGDGWWLRPTCTDDAAVVGDSTPLRLDCVVPGKVLERVRLVNPKGEERGLKHVKEGRLTHTSGLDGHYYRLSEGTAVMFDEVIGL
jgi:hypothetical protein